MALFEKRILYEAEDETRYYKWRPARAEVDPSAGAIAIYEGRGKRPAFTIQAGEIVRFEIVPRKEVSALHHVVFGALYVDSSTGLGCLLSAVLAPIAIFEAISSRKARFPVIKLTQSADDISAGGWVFHLRSKRRRYRGRVETRELADCIKDLLRTHGYGDFLPDLSVDELWFGP
jgi:hypothetical protein